MLCFKATAIKRQKITVLKFSRLYTTQIYSELTFNDIFHPWGEQKFKHTHIHKLLPIYPQLHDFSNWNIWWSHWKSPHIVECAVNKMAIKEDKKEKLDDSNDEKVRY